MNNSQNLKELVASLREANQNLVLASLRANELQDQAEAVNHRQKEFLSMLAHELRNPLAPIATSAELLHKIAGAHPELPHIEQVISRQVGHMRRLLEDLLDVSRVSTGKITLQTGPVFLSDVIGGAAEIARTAIDVRGQTLMIDLPAQAVVLEGDAMRLAQVFSNLLINASKYSPEALPITIQTDLSEGGTVAVSVRDQGCGIDPQIQPYIFDLFTQGSRTLDRSEGGLGIGLALVRSLVEMHGGTVRVHSDGLGKGSEFTVVLPTSTQPALPTVQPNACDLARSCRILVIEDNVDGNDTLNACLTMEGHSVVSVYNGPSGLEMARSTAFDLILCDIGLPGLSGYEVIRQIRQCRLDPRPYCIALSGYDQADYLKNAEHAGFDQYLVKPVEFSQLLERVAAAFPLAAAA